jgi:Zn-dependent peptidase ImmA (M78 family)
MLENADTLLRSTIAHELGHLVFDAPGWVLIPPAAPVRSGFAAFGTSRDPRELRANEFMGALLVAPSLLRVDLQRQAKRHRFAPSQRPSTVIAGAPAYDGSSLDLEAVEEVIFTLAERYVVSESFLRVRLDRYDLLRSGRSWQSHGRRT